MAVKVGKTTKYEYAYLSWRYGLRVAVLVRSTKYGGVHKLGAPAVKSCSATPAQQSRQASKSSSPSPLATTPDSALAPSIPPPVEFCCRRRRRRSSIASFAASQRPLDLSQRHTVLLAVASPAPGRIGRVTASRSSGLEQLVVSAVHTRPHHGGRPNRRHPGRGMEGGPRLVHARTRRAHCESGPVCTCPPWLIMLTPSARCPHSPAGHVLYPPQGVRHPRPQGPV